MWCADDKKTKQLRYIDLNRRLKDLEMQHKKKPCPTLLNKIKTIRNEINLMYTQEIEKKMVFVKQKY